MRITLAYILVVALSQILASIGIFLVSMLFGYLFLWLPEDKRPPIVSFISGICGPLISFALGLLIFLWVGGRHTLGIFPGIAISIPLLFAIRKDYLQYQGLAKIQAESETDATSIVAKLTAPTTRASGTMVLGEVLGVLLGIAWFCIR